MSVNYDLYETPDLAKSGEEQPLHARVVLKGSYTAEEFVEQVTALQHMPHAQVVGIIEAISKELRHLLLKGFSVEYYPFLEGRKNYHLMKQIILTIDLDKGRMATKQSNARLMAKDLIAGCFGGIGIVAVGHPFDTLKVNILNLECQYVP